MSVNPPGHFVWEPETIDEQIRYYSKLCENDPYCSSITDNLAETMHNVFHNMPKRWLVFPIDSDKVRMAAFMGLYHRGSAASVFDAIIAVEKGDPSGLALVSMMFSIQMRTMDFAWGDSFSKSYADYDPNRDYLMDMGLKENTIMGSPGSQLFAIQHAWPGKPLPQKFNKAQKTDVETLLVSVNIDFSTPAEFARDELLPYITNGQQVILSEFGHTGDVMYWKKEAFDHLLTTYFKSRNVDTSKYHYEPMTFEPDQRFPAMAKISLAIGVAAILILGLIIWGLSKVFKRLRSRLGFRQGG